VEVEFEFCHVGYGSRMSNFGQKWLEM
jgi:hypothetical protein